MRKGFTLIELLVVIAIIAILAAILFPVFARARAKAQQNNCLSNVKQIQLGLIMYASDNNQRYPIASGTGTPDWANAVYPYIKNSQIYLCPTDATTYGSLTYTGPSIFGGSGANPGGSYGFNNGNTVSVGTDLGALGNADANILYPSEMLGIIDAGATTVTAPTTGILIGTNARHNSGSNQSYMDGHAKWVATTNIPVWVAGATSNDHYWCGTDNGT
jgi:prepilin-type N-terminal cleavage/methylation domain-containing protein/prepilin-type processing-associated H-X9-DG protein